MVMKCRENSKMSYKQKLPSSTWSFNLVFMHCFLQLHVNILWVTEENDGRPLLILLVLSLPVTKPLKLARVLVSHTPSEVALLLMPASLSLPLYLLHSEPQNHAHSWEDIFLDL